MDSLYLFNDWIKQIVFLFSRQLSSCGQCNQQLQSAMANEKAYAMKCIRDLEHKLMEAQDTLMQKIREVASAREMQTTLRAEIESYKAILECQEAK